MKPWEKRQNLKPSLKPWEKRTQISSSPEAANSLMGGYYNFPENKYPEFLKYSDRFLMKNFASSPEVAVENLKKRYPGVQVEIRDGEIVMRNNDGNWYKLDPSFTASLSDPKEFLRDAGDIVTDALGGAAEAAGTAVGATMGTAINPGVGTMAGASVANAMTAGAVEAAKQGIGSALGLEDNLNPQVIANTTVAGAASPLLFGAGKVPLTKGVQDAVARKYGLEAGSMAIEDKVNQISRGAAKRVYDGAKRTVLPKIGEFVSGAPKEDILGYADNMDLVDSLQGDSIKLGSYVNATREDMINKINQLKMQYRQEIIDSLNGKEISVKEAKDVYKNQIAKLRQSVNPQGGVDQGNVALADALEEDFKYIFGIDYADETKQVIKTKMTDVTPDPTKEPVYVDYQMPDKTVTKTASGKQPVFNEPPVIKDSLGVPLGGSEKTMTSDVPVLVKGANGELPIYSTHDIGNGQRYHKIQEGVNPDKAQFNKEISMAPDVGEPDGFSNSLVQFQQVVPGEKKTAVGYKTVHADPKFEVATVVSSTKTNPKDGYFDPITLNFVKPPTEHPDVVSGETAFSLMRKATDKAKYDATKYSSVTQAGKDAKQAITRSMETATGGASQGGKDKFSNLVWIEDNTGNMFASDDATYKNLMRLDSNNNRIKRSAVDNLKEIGVDVGNAPTVLGALRTFGDPALLPQGLKGTTSTSRTNATGALGYWLGSKLPFDTGKLVGAVGLNYLGSPNNLKHMMKTNKFLEDFAKKQYVAPAITPAGTGYLTDKINGWTGAE